jgi:4-hydroxy-tetrahydrodipicolinate synthase
MSFEHLLLRQKGVSGIVLLGTTGEAPTLEREEKTALIKKGRDLTSLPLIIGTTSSATKEVILRNQEAFDLGANAVMVASPYYNKPSQEGLYRHFMTIADHSPLPLILYNHPGRTGVNIEKETLKRLIPHENIVALKEASGTLKGFVDAIEAVGDFPVFCGDDSLIAPAISLGAKGVISVISNLIPEKISEAVYRLLKKEDVDLSDLKEVLEILSLDTNPVPVKAVLAHFGLCSKRVRLPLCEMKQPIRIICEEKPLFC